MLRKIAQPPTQKEATPAQNCAAIRERVKVTSSTLIPDIIHDLLEGVLPLELK